MKDQLYVAAGTSGSMPLLLPFSAWAGLVTGTVHDSVDSVGTAHQGQGWAMRYGPLGPSGGTGSKRPTGAW